MRRAPTLLLIACLAVGIASLPGFGPFAGTARAQSIEVGGGVEVAAPSGSRVNVRSAPEVTSGNIVASARGGDLLRVTEAAERGDYTWYRIESLSGSAPNYQGWIRGDLLRPALLVEAAPAGQPASGGQGVSEQTLPELLAETANGNAAAPTGTTVAEPVPYPERTDWSRNILRLYPAILGCVRINSAPPVTVLRAVGRSRGLAEVIMSDSAERRWDCVISDNGGTPIRYDPLSGALYVRDRLANEPFFQIGEARPNLDPNCYRFERVVDPTTEAQLGWLIYRTCR